MNTKLALVTSAIVLSGCAATSNSTNSQATAADVADTYVRIANAVYSDSLSTAQVLRDQVAAFVANPTEDSFNATKQAWLSARVPYGQTEVYRFGNAVVDDWEGKVNAWPLDEGLIDYVATSYEYEDGNPFANANIIAGDEPINTDLLASYHEQGGSEANVATGYHAVEFLLWGQDLNESPGAAGQRSYTDFVVGDGCTNGNCERRAQYLLSAADLLVSDLEEIVADWAPGADNYRAEFVALDDNEALRRILFGMGSLSLGELAGERINVALLAHSQEDEHSCFSDNTHVDIAENARGIENVYLGRYERVDGSVVEGPGIAQLVAQQDPELSTALTAKLAASQSAADLLVDSAVAGAPFDQLISADNAAGNQQVQAVIDALRTQTGDIESVATLLGVSNLNPETSDSFGG